MAKLEDVKTPPEAGGEDSEEVSFPCPGQVSTQLEEEQGGEGPQFCPVLRRADGGFPSPRPRGPSRGPRCQVAPARPPPVPAAGISEAFTRTEAESNNTDTEIIQSAE